MKVGIDCRLWSETGVGRYIRNLVLNLQKIDKKNEYLLFILPKDEENIKRNWKLEIGNWKLRPADIRWHTLEEQLKFPRILNRENLDLMHFSYHSVPIFYNRPFVLTIHDLIPYNFPTGKASALPFFLYWVKFLAYKYVLRNAVRKAKRIIAVSNATKKEIVDHLGDDGKKITVIYEGVDDALNPKSEIRNPKKSQNPKYSILNTQYFLYVGNVFPHKNVDRLIEAFGLLSPQNDIKLILVGKEDYFYQRLKKKVEEMKISNIIFLHDATDEELVNLYKNAIALVNPSLMEGFGLPVLEAMANGCLVLTSDILALREICGDAAIYFNPYDIKDIEKKMKDIYFKGLNHFSEKIEKGLERVKVFSWEKMAEETLKVYNSLEL